MLFELKTIRKKSGLSQEDAADQLGVPIGTYRNWEQLKTMPRDRGDIPRLARFFGVTVEDLFGEDFVVPGTLNDMYETPKAEKPQYRVIDKRLEAIGDAYEAMNENGRHVLHSVATSLARDPANAGGE
ncbi:MAG: helix-turn-helix transcriptional regulator [Collinsella sp.]|jgi:transcriptional regulator with XRE-family HTH domain|nr:helix-turn-helix transcriptional regulator [Collinsella sp.]